MPDNMASSKDLIERLLSYDLSHFAAFLGLGDAPPELSDRNAVDLLNLAEQDSRDASDEAKNRCLMICGLLWEYRKPEWKAMSSFVVTLLSRIGLAPTIGMIDPGAREEQGKMSPLGSLAHELAVMARFMETQVTLKNAAILLLSQFQYDVWRTIDTHKRVGISAPTSAGKSYVLVEKALDLLWEASGSIVYIVPTIALIQQVSHDFRIAATRHNMPDLRVLQGAPEIEEHDTPVRIVYVLTQERARSLIEPSRIQGRIILIVDEIQNIERISSEDEDRAKTLYDVVQGFANIDGIERIIISGPRVENILQLSRELFGDSAQAVTADVPPVVNMTYTFAKEGNQISIKQYSSLRKMPGKYLLENNEVVPLKVFGKQQYRAEIHDFLALLVEKLAPNGTLVFSPTSSQAAKTAIELAERIHLPVSGRVGSLINYAAQTVHPNYGLTKCLRGGVAYHHGKVPQHLRYSIEQAFSDQEIKVIACTTTLMQGVNLPAKNLIIRNPHLYVRKNSDGRSVELTAYEFGNLRGRAGRLLKDFVGRAIVLDEKSFEDADVDFDFATTQVSAGYRERFTTGRSEIMKQLLTGGGPRATLRDNDIVTTIRRSVFRYGIGALERLGRSGITISDEEYTLIKRQLSNLTVNTAICDSNPYWDPVELDKLTRLETSGQLLPVPTSPFDPLFVAKMLAVINQLKQVVQYYYARILSDVDEHVLFSIIVSAQKWAQEKSLREIIGWGTNVASLSSEEIDSRLQRVSQDAAYNLPKLLRPVVLIHGNNNPILGFIEMGGYHPTTRKLIELGLPRETAVRARHLLGQSSISDDSTLVRKCFEISRQMNEWEASQIVRLLPST